MLTEGYPPGWSLPEGARRGICECVGYLPLAPRDPRLPGHALGTGRPVLIRVLGELVLTLHWRPWPPYGSGSRKRAPHGCGVTTVDQAARTAESASSAETVSLV